MIIGDIIRIKDTDFYVDEPYEIIEIILMGMMCDIIVTDKIIKHKISNDYVGVVNLVNEYDCYLDVVSMRKRKLKKLLK